MKKRKLKSKLLIKKEAISNLNSVKGGKPCTFGCVISVEMDCQGTFGADCN